MSEQELQNELEQEALEQRELDAIVLVDDYGFEWTGRELANAMEEQEVRVNLAMNKD